MGEPVPDADCVERFYLRAVREFMSVSRRYLLRRAACGFGLVGLQSLMAAEAANPLAARPGDGHRPGRS